jgi:hypothetical protein
MGCFSRCLLGITQPFIQLFEQPDDQTRVSGFAQPNPNRVLTFEDLERLDVAYDQELPCPIWKGFKLTRLGRWLV